MLAFWAKSIGELYGSPMEQLRLMFRLISPGNDDSCVKALSFTMGNGIVELLLVKSRHSPFTGMRMKMLQKSTRLKSFNFLNFLLRLSFHFGTQNSYICAIFDKYSTNGLDYIRLKNAQGVLRQLPRPR
jgi:hypothetical protein